ncbi:hypothetical protein K32_48700 [Kaistia sp. 32K]|nr:hypothetical protein [Kaistia sp. 32K]BCP56253.1 hypothetical protein K32_48700 [Kaistia sp. 32K]
MSPNPLIAAPIIAVICLATDAPAFGLLVLTLWSACVYEAVERRIT